MSVTTCAVQLQWRPTGLQPGTDAVWISDGYQKWQCDEQSRLVANKVFQLTNAIAARGTTPLLLANAIAAKGTTATHIGWYPGHGPADCATFSPAADDDVDIALGIGG